LARPEYFTEISRHAACLGNKQNARRITVEPMHEHRTIAIFIGHGGQHAIDMPRHTRAALHRQPIGLIQDHQIAILEEDHLA
jgi:hypothetical protein